MFERETLGDRARRMQNQRARGERVYLPPGWPQQVLPPGVNDWERSATAFLLDCCPPDYRAYPVLTRHAIVLAFLAKGFVSAQLKASEENIRQARAHLMQQVGVNVIEQTLSVLQQEHDRLSRLKRAVDLVDHALKGVIFVEKL